jgi:rhodanese-related sulfurtransferase
MSDIRRVSPAEAHEKMRAGYIYVDVRTPEEFAEGHPAGAFNVPIALAHGGSMAPNDDFIAVMKGNFAPDAKIVVGCQAGGRSMRAARALLAAGFTDVIEQRAGWSGARDPFGRLVEPGWSRCDLPTEVGQPEGRSYASLANKRAQGQLPFS